MSAESWLLLSKIVSFVGLFLVFVSTVSSSVLSAKVDRIKDARIDTLVKGNAELLKKIDLYQADLDQKEKRIEELQVAAKKASRGISSTYNYTGVKHDTQPGVIKGEIGPEREVFQQMRQLHEEGRWEELITLCTGQIQRTPDWYTPYLFRGVARANIGETERALQDIQYVVDNTPGDPEYEHAIDILKKIQAKNQKD